MIATRPFYRAVALTLALATRLSASDLTDDLAARRTRLAERLGAETMLIVTSAPTRRYSLDVDYEYRQDSNLYYLTGVAQDGTSLILLPGNRTIREILFIKDADPSQEHWRGHHLTNAEAVARSGVQKILPASQFESVVAALLSRQPAAGMTAEDGEHFFAALGSGQARLAFPLDSGRPDEPLTPTQELARRLRDRYAGFQTVDATPLLTDLRLVKTAVEQQLLKKATDISADAQMAGMRVARPGVYEYEVKAAIEAVHRSRGAVSWAYPSIVGSGPNATILHYPSAVRQMTPGDLLLVDAACNYEYMSPDITRTYPISGTFSEPQKALYAIVLQAEDEAMAAATVGSSLAQVHDKAVDVIKTGLLTLGLITDASGDQYRMWFTHGTSHYIGIDVHDVGDRRRPLQPGMAFTIEPGIYIRQSALDALPRTDENAALIEKLRPAVAKYEGIGVRVEDSFLLEAQGPRRRCAAVPRTMPAIEAFMRQRPASGASR